MERNIVILGAGFGGIKATLTLAKKASWLAKRGYKIILVDRNEYHTYTPTLYEIGTTSKSVANYIDLKSVSTFPIKEILEDQNVVFRKAEIELIDTKRGLISLIGGDKIPYAYLIVALGSETNYFNIPGLEEKAHGIKTFKEALELRDAIWGALNGASHNDEVSIVVGGAGSAGVELTAEIQEWFMELKREGAKCKAKTTIIDANDKILHGLDPRVSGAAERRLRKLGVNIIENAFIKEVRGNKIEITDDTRVRFDVLAWSGGVSPSKIATSLPIKLAKNGGIEVKPTLEIKPKKKNQIMRGKVYAVGDIVAFKDSVTKKYIPWVARPAIQEGRIAATNVILNIKNRKERVFKPTQYPYIVPVGGKHAVAKVGPFVITSFLGWIAKGLIELTYLSSIMNFKMAIGIWLRGLKIFIQNDRLG